MRDLGEFPLIDRLTADRDAGPDVLLGPGDDAAVLRAPDGRVTVSTDMLVEGRHFRRDWSDPADIGRKAIAQNAADIVAMGARPTGFVVALGCPSDTPVEQIEALYRGMRAEVARSGGGIAGGDLVAAAEWVISVTAFGDLAGRPACTRSGARPGDVLAVAGRLGWSAAGLAVLSGDADTADPRFTAAVDIHRAPRPPYSAVLDVLRPGAVSGAPPVEVEPGVVRESGCGDIGSGAGGTSGEAVAAPAPTAMTDISDGLLADLGHLASASGVRIDVTTEHLADPELTRIAEALDADAGQWILTGGEDHAFAATWGSAAQVPPGWTVIGVVHAGSGVTVDGQASSLPGGWESFRGSAR